MCSTLIVKKNRIKRQCIASNYRLLSDKARMRLNTDCIVSQNSRYIPAPICNGKFKLLFNFVHLKDRKDKVELDRIF